MSRTNRNKIKRAADWKNINPHKSKPYVADKDKGHSKFKATKTEYVDGYMKGITATDKLITRNANRSLKKGMRQQSKKLIESELVVTNTIEN